MDSSWFDFAIGDNGVDVGDPLRRRTGTESRSSWRSRTTSHVSTASVSHLSFLEESRRLDQELRAASGRLRDTTRLSAGDDRVQGIRRASSSGFAARRLDFAQRLNELMTDSTEGSNFQKRDQNDEKLNANLQAIKEENMKLQAVITDVTEVNKRWQKYNNDRQIYMQKLLSTIQDQQEQMNKAFDQRSCVPRDSVFTDKEHSCLQEEVNQQQTRLESMEKKYREHVAVLEFQVKAHKDDWEVERSERQQVLKDKLVAEAKVRQLQKDVRCLKLKLREERLENSSHCTCCNAHVGEPEQRADVPSVKTKPCRKEHSQSKTYRTSVHLPCTSGHALPKGTILSFGEDLVNDNEENSPSNNETSMQPEGFLTSATNSDDDSELSSIHTSHKSVELKTEADTSGLVRRKVSRCQGSGVDEDSNNGTQGDKKLASVPQSASQPNLTTSTSLSCAILHLSPRSTVASLPTECATASDSHIDSASGVTIGFSSNGLASVFSFPQQPIAKSFSLPTSRGIENTTFYECELPVSQTSSLGSSWSMLPIQRTPASVSSSESLLPEKRSDKLSILGAFAKSIKQSVESDKDPEKPCNDQDAMKNTSALNANYFEDGVATQTKEDLICPGCGLVFPPILHVKFLDHFEKCQANTK